MGFEFEEVCALKKVKFKHNPITVPFFNPPTTFNALCKSDSTYLMSYFNSNELKKGNYVRECCDTMYLNKIYRVYLKFGVTITHEEFNPQMINNHIQPRSLILLKLVSLESIRTEEK